MTTRWRTTWALLMAIGCSSSGGSPVPAVSSNLASGASARVGSELISADMVARIAASQGVLPRVAVGLAVSDALFAVEARVSLPPASTRVIERAAAARSLLEQLKSDAASVTPTHAELAAIVHERWVELDRPAAVRTTHAVVLNDKPERDAAARAVADHLLETLRDVTDSEELLRRAREFPAAGFEVRAEALPFVTPDGRVFVRRGSEFSAKKGSFDLAFARAANDLQQRGQLSPVAKSRFGYHVIRLEERAPSAVLPEQEWVTEVGPEALVRRAQRARRELLARLRQAHPVQLERALDELTAQVDVAP